MNMKNEDHVVSLEIAKEMEELGAEQDSLWYWTWAGGNEGVEWVVILKDERARIKKENYSAYTVAELGEMLPGHIMEMIGDFKTRSYYLDCGKVDSGPLYYVRYIRHDTGDTFYLLTMKTEAEVRAKVWIWLKKAGLI